MKTEKQVIKYLNKIMNIIIPCDWRIKICFWDESKEDENSGFESYADIDVDYTYKKAIIRIFPSFWEESEEEKKKTIIHELVHILLGFHKFWFESKTTENMIPYTVRSAIEDGMVKDEENMVCHLTEVFYEIIG